MTWKEFKTMVDGQLRALGGDDESQVEGIDVDSGLNRLCVHVKNQDNTIIIHN
jgi:hypothetical protein